MKCANGCCLAVVRPSEIESSISHRIRSTMSNGSCVMIDSRNHCCKLVIASALLILSSKLLLSTW
uniref:Uncharacterized protein n=1 Tax=Arundo donax TaxID=35708 RepID=A0A0A9C4Z9_ARUDO